MILPQKIRWWATDVKDQIYQAQAYTHTSKTKLLKREAESALDEPTLTWQRIFNIVNKSNVE